MVAIGTMFFTACDSDSSSSSPSADNSRTESASVLGTANIYAPTAGGDGTPASSVQLTSGDTSVRITSVMGTVSLDKNNFAGNTADGGAFLAPTTVQATNGFSGISADTTGFLVGMFADPSSSSTPSDLDFSGSGINFTSLSPELNQPFFIGDGDNGNQIFNIPSGASILYLGIADGLDTTTFNIGGPVNFYVDNGGSFDVSLSIE